MSARTSRRTDRLTDTLTDTLTDANRFYNLSHAICYSYGTDNKRTHPNERRHGQRPPCCQSWRHSWWQRNGQQTNSYQDVALHEYLIFTHNLGNWLMLASVSPIMNVRTCIKTCKKTEADLGSRCLQSCHCIVVVHQCSISADIPGDSLCSFLQRRHLCVNNIYNSNINKKLSCRKETVWLLLG